MESPFRIAGPCTHGARMQVLMTPPGEVMPIVYLAVEGAFQGLPTTTIRPGWHHDTLVFGAAVAEFLSKVGATGRQFIWGADWQMVPALTRLRTRHHTVLTLHNEFDAWLAREASDFGGGLYPLFRGQETALRDRLELADARQPSTGAMHEGCRHRTHSHAGDGPSSPGPGLEDRAGRERQFFVAEPADTKSWRRSLASSDSSSGLKVIEDAQRRRHGPRFPR